MSQTAFPSNAAQPTNASLAVSDPSTGSDAETKRQARQNALADALEVQFSPDEVSGLQAQFARALPALLVSLIERRYLSELDPDDWVIAARHGDNARPLLREVTSLGRPENTEAWASALPHALSACHEPGHALVQVLHGTGARHRLFVGARRIIGDGARSTEDFLDAHASIMKAHVGGLQLGEIRRVDVAEAPDLTTFLENAPCLAVVTGIPSGRGPGGLPLDTQSVDRLVKAVGAGRYAVVTVAEPIAAERIDDAIDACRKLQSEVHAFVRRTVGRNTGGGTSVSRTESEEVSESKTAGVAASKWGAMVPLGVTGVTQLVAAAGAIAGHVAQEKRQEASAQTQYSMERYQAQHPGQTFGGGAVQMATLAAGVRAVGPVLSVLTAGFPLLSAVVNIGGAALTTYVSKTEQATAGKSQNVSESESWGESGSVELLDANAAFCEKLLEDHIARLQEAKSGGWWQTSVYTAGENEAVVWAVSGALRALCAGPTSALDPLRTHILPPHLLREAVVRGQTLTLTARDDNDDATPPNPRHPLGPPFETLGTCLHGGEAAILLNLPFSEIPGLPMRDLTDFSLSAPPSAPGTIPLGDLLDSLGRPLGGVAVTEGALNRHTFITGMTGYGKSNTAMQILFETYNTLGVPFLVLEPAKAEYRLLAQMPEFRDVLRVYSIGGATGLPFRLNPLAPVPGIPLSRHVDLLKAVFNASFPMYAGMPYVLEEAIIEVYRDRGWSLSETDNPHLSPRSSMDERSALTPSLEDLYDKIEVVLKRRNYGQEIHQNMGAALRSRLRSLMMGNKGLVFNTRRATPLRDLFEVPCIIELKNLGDDEEKAFVMALLFTFLYEYAEVRQRDIPLEKRGKRLGHLTLIEEAHRLLTATHGSGGTSETGDPKGKAVTMFTDMLAEMRAYGEGFVIADQIPTKLAPETLKNSNLKIVHRLAAPDDREITGACLNLNSAQIRHLNNLKQGEAIVHNERLGEAALVQIVNFKDLRAPIVDEDALQKLLDAQEASNPLSLMRDGGCVACPAPCKFFARYRDMEENERAPLAAPLRRVWEGLAVHALNLANADASSETTPVADTDEASRAWAEWRAWRTQLAGGAAPSLTAGATPAALVGLTYCAATRLAHDWLQDALKARGALWGRAALTPTDRLACEHAARALGLLTMAWIKASDAAADATETAAVPPDAQTAWDTARATVNAALFASPPRDRGGCPACPARCRMLPFVAAYQPALAKVVQAELSKTASGAETARGVCQTVSGANGATIPFLARRAGDERLRRDFAYCVLANTPPARANDAAETARRDAALSALRGDDAFPPEAPPAAAPAFPVADPLAQWRANLPIVPGA